MTRGEKLSELQDNVIPTETLDKVVISFGSYPLVLNTYAYINDPAFTDNLLYILLESPRN